MKRMFFLFHKEVIGRGWDISGAPIDKSLTIHRANIIS